MVLANRLRACTKLVMMALIELKQGCSLAEINYIVLPQIGLSTSTITVKSLYAVYNAQCVLQFRAICLCFGYSVSILSFESLSCFRFLLVSFSVLF